MLFICSTVPTSAAPASTGPCSAGHFSSISIYSISFKFLFSKIINSQIFLLKKNIYIFFYIKYFIIFILCVDFWQKLSFLNFLDYDFIWLTFLDHFLYITKPFSFGFLFFSILFWLFCFPSFRFLLFLYLSLYFWIFH